MILPTTLFLAWRYLLSRRVLGTHFTHEHSRANTHTHDGWFAHRASRVRAAADPACRMANSLHATISDRGVLSSEQARGSLGSWVTTTSAKYHVDGAW